MFLYIQSIGYLFATSATTTATDTVYHYFVININLAKTVRRTEEHTTLRRDLFQSAV